MHREMIPMNDDIRPSRRNIGEMRGAGKVLRLLGLALLLCAGFAGCSPNNAESTETTESRQNAISGDITYFYFGYSTGNMKDAYVRYELTLEDEVYTARVKPNGVPDEQAAVVKVEKSFAGELGALMERYGVDQWNGFDKSDTQVLDGNSFSLTVYRGEEKISARGYMKWPKNYGDFKAAVNKLFEEAVK